jgi:hypothetical protein
VLAFVISVSLIAALLPATALPASAGIFDDIVDSFAGATGAEFKIDRVLWELPEANKAVIPNYKDASTKPPTKAGNTVAAGCERYPGLTKAGKVWTGTYVGSDSTVKMRFKFWTRYDEGVANYWRAAMDTWSWPNLRLTCQMLFDAERFNRSYGNDRASIEAVKAAARDAPFSQPQYRSSRWCRLMALAPADRPATVDLGLNEKCRRPELNTNADGKRVWRGPVTNAQWFESNTKFDHVDLIEEGINAGELPSWTPGHITADVFIDNYEQMGGVSYGQNGKQFRIERNGSTGRDTYVGYGNVQTLGASNGWVTWFDQQAIALGKDPYKNPKGAHQAVLNRMQTFPNGKLAQDRDFLHAFVCAGTPKIADLLDKPGHGNSLFGRPSDVGIDQMLRAWVDKEVGNHRGYPANNYICQALKADPELATFASIGCQYWVFPMLLHQMWQNKACMNRPDDGIANLLGVDLGCGRYPHFRNLMKRFKGFLSEGPG